MGKRHISLLNIYQWMSSSERRARIFWMTSVDELFPPKSEKRQIEVMKSIRVLLRLVWTIIWDDERKLRTWCMNLVINDGFSNGIRNCISISFMAQVVQHIDGSIYHRNWIGNILSSNSRSGITGTWLKYSILKRIQRNVKYFDFKRELSS